jgi:hypothetical protein
MRWALGHFPGAILGLGLLGLAVAAPAEARRLALVIGNDAYQNVTPLNNAGSDARAVAAALRETGFTVTLRQDLSLQSMKETLRAFKAQIAGGDDAVFYYSGHGVQLGGSNYLIPVDIRPQDEEEVADDALPLQRVLDDMSEQKARFSLAIIDACRNNPFKQSGRAIGGRGLAPVTAATGQMILYSAGAGQEALDNLGPADRNPNGVFTRVLIGELRDPGVPAEQILKRVRDQVVALAQSAHHDQVPALYDQSLGEFYFVPGKAAPGAGGGPAGARDGDLRVQSTAEVEQEYWNRIKDSTDPKDFADYGRSYPQGPHSAEAALLLRRMSVPAASTAVPTAPAPAPDAPPPTSQPLAVTIAPNTFNGREVAEAPGLMFAALKDIPGIDASMAATAATTTAYGVGGNVIAVQPTLQRNQCATQNNQINQMNLACMLLGQSTAPFSASVPVQIDFRVLRNSDHRITPYLFAKTYTVGAQQAQDAQTQALALAIREGTLAALQSAGVLEQSSDPKTRKVTYNVSALAQNLAAAANLGATSSAPAAATSTVAQLLPQANALQARAAMARSVVPATAAAPAPVTAAAAVAPTVDPIQGAWEGSYRCGQGVEGMKLRLTRAPGAVPNGVAALTGIVEFYPLAANPMGASGSYQVAGNYFNGRLVVTPQRWISQPPGYGMAGLIGTVSGAVISGNMAGAGCTQFQLNRVSQ